MKSKIFKRKGVDGVFWQTLLILFMCVNIFLVFLPILITLISSFKSTGDLMANSIFSWPQDFIFSNWSTGFGTVLPNMLNSVIIGLVTTLGVVMIGALTAYVFVRKKFFGKKILFKFIIAAMLIPSIITLTPLYLLMLDLNLKNSWFSLWFPSITGGAVGALFLFYTFFKQQPKDLFEAGKVDGANDLILFFQMTLPLAIPILAVQSINTFSGAYNDFLWPSLIITNRSLKPLMPVLNIMVEEVKFDEQGVKYALYLLSGIPLIFTTLFGLKFFVDGDFAAGMKM